MHNLEAIVELAKQGMTYEQIKDLITVQSQDEQKDEPKPKPNDPEPTDPGAGQETSEPDKEYPEPDYKKLYEQSQKDLKAAQELNKKQNNETQNEKSEDEKLADLFTELYF